MEVSSLTVENWRGLKHLSLHMTPGVNVAWGPNESGKSSLREALWAAFTLPPRPRGRSLLSDARPWNLADGDPSVEVLFRHGGSAWRLKKVFGKRGSELERDGRLIAKDDRVQETVSATFAEAGIGSLWTAQGNIDMVEVAPEVRPLLAASEVVSPGASWLEGQVDALFGRYWTDKQERPKKPIQDARDRVAGARSEIRDIEETLADVESINQQIELLDHEQRELDEAQQQAGAALELARARVQNQMRSERDRAECDVVEQQLMTEEGWLARWQEQRTLLLQAWDRQQDQDAEVHRLAAQIGVAPDRQSVERLRIRKAFIGQRIQLLLEEQLRILRAPTATQMESLEALSADLRVAETLEREITEIASLRDQLGVLEAREKQAAEAVQEAESAEQETVAGLDQSCRETEASLKVLTDALAQIERDAESWRQLRVLAIDMRTEVVSYQDRLASLKAQMGRDPSRDAIGALQRKLTYCQGRLQMLLEVERHEVGIKDIDALNRLREILKKIEELGTPSLPPKEQRRSNQVLRLSGLSVAVGLTGGAFALVSGLGMGLTVGIFAIITMISVALMFRFTRGRVQPAPRKDSERDSLCSERDELFRRLGSNDLEEIESQIARAERLRTRDSADGVGAGEISKLRMAVTDADRIDSLNPAELNEEILLVHEALDRSETGWSHAQTRRLALQSELEMALQASPIPRLQLILERIGDLLKNWESEPELIPEATSAPWWDELASGLLREPFLKRLESAKDELAKVRLRRDHELRALESGLRKAKERGSVVREKWQQTRAEKHQLLGNIQLRFENATRLIATALSLLDRDKLSDRLRRLSAASTSEIHDVLDRIRDLKRKVSEESEDLLSELGVTSLDDALARMERARLLLSRLVGRAQASLTPEDLRVLGDSVTDLEKMTFDELQLELSTLPDQIRQAEEQWQKETSSYTTTRARYEDSLKKDLSQRIEAYVEDLRTLAKERLALRIQVPEKPGAGWIKELQEKDHTAGLRSELKQRRTELAQRRAALTSEEVQIGSELQKEVGAREGQLREIRARREEVSRQLQQFLGRIRDHRELYGRLVRAREALSAKFAEQRQLELEGRAAALLRSAIGEAKRSLESDIVGPLRERIGKRLAQLTAGRYRGIQLNQNFDADSLVTESNRSALPQHLSFGTQEQLAFLSRLSLAELLSEKERHLVVFDDQLVHTDSLRLKVACELLIEVANKVQVLLLTCHPERFSALEGRAAFSEIRSE
jgi:DNA repair exonuclease SbcCD ATPase subunit